MFLMRPEIDTSIEEVRSAAHSSSLLPRVWDTVRSLAAVLIIGIPGIASIVWGLTLLRDEFIFFVAPPMIISGILACLHVVFFLVRPHSLAMRIVACITACLACLPCCWVYIVGMANLWLSRDLLLSLMFTVTAIIFLFTLVLTTHQILHVRGPGTAIANSTGA